MLFRAHGQALIPFDETIFSDVSAGTDARNIITKAQPGGSRIKMEINDRIK